MLWILIATSLLGDGRLLAFIDIFIILIPTAETWAEHFSVAGYYYKGVTVSPPPLTDSIWVPCLAFEVILALLAVWAGIKHSRKQSYSRPATLNKPRLVNSLIQGNVIYFLGWEFLSHCWRGSDTEAQSSRDIHSASEP